MHLSMRVARSDAAWITVADRLARLFSKIAVGLGLLCAADPVWSRAMIGYGYCFADRCFNILYAHVAVAQASSVFILVI